MDLQTIRTRIDSLLEMPFEDSNIDRVVLCTELYHGTLTLLSSIYGHDSHQVSGLRKLADDIYREQGNALQHRIFDLISTVRGSLQNLKAELDAGLAGSLQKSLQGEILTDFVQLARAVLDEKRDGAKNVAAVLAAAAFEDTIRKMGTIMAGVVGKDDLSDVVNALKTSGALVSPQLGIAQSYLNFRNRALHANWDDIQLETVYSVLGFVEQLLLKHFSNYSAK